MIVLHARRAFATVFAIMRGLMNGRSFRRNHLLRRGWRRFEAYRRVHYPISIRAAQLIKGFARFKVQLGKGRSARSKSCVCEEYYRLSRLALALSRLCMGKLFNYRTFLTTVSLKCRQIMANICYLNKFTRRSMRNKHQSKLFASLSFAEVSSNQVLHSRISRRDSSPRGRGTQKLNPKIFKVNERRYLGKWLQFFRKIVSRRLFNQSVIPVVNPILKCYALLKFKAIERRRRRRILTRYAFAHFFNRILEVAQKRQIWLFAVEYAARYALRIALARLRSVLVRKFIRKVKENQAARFLVFRRWALAFTALKCRGISSGNLFTGGALGNRRKQMK